MTTPAEGLRAARLIEAKRRWIENETPRREVEHLADLYESNWTPPEPEVDADLAAARVWCAERWGGHDNYLPGKHDASPEIRAYLAGCTRGREGAKGLVEALEALHNMASDALDSVSYVRVRSRLRDGIENARAALASAKRGG